jgi:hypothetical protein
MKGIGSAAGVEQGTYARTQGKQTRNGYEHEKIKIGTHASKLLSKPA